MVRVMVAERKSMLKYIKLLMTIPPVFTDGFLLVLSSFCAGVLTYLATEEAYKYVCPTLLFWTKVTLGSTSSSISALVAFRSKVYSRHLQQVKADASGVAQTTTVQPTKLP